MISAIFILLAAPFLDTSRIRSMQFRPIMKFFFWLFVVNFIILTWIGSQHPEQPLVTIGQISTIFYFSYFLIILPVVGIIENTLFDLATKETKSNNSQRSEGYNEVKALPPTFKFL
jgi:quinol-cytochrome oxidoreductase complex cytochrome b subunit